MPDLQLHSCSWLASSSHSKDLNKSVVNIRQRFTSRRCLSTNCGRHSGPRPFGGRKWWIEYSRIQRSFARRSISISSYARTKRSITAHYAKHNLTRQKRLAISDQVGQAERRHVGAGRRIVWDQQHALQARVPLRLLRILARNRRGNEPRS